MKRQAGFTIVELVVVIALLGILAAVALPRFMDVTSNAHASSVKGVGGGLASGVAMAKAQAVIENVSAATTVTMSGGTTVNVNANGYPYQETGGALTAADCVSIWGEVLQGGAPVVTSVAYGSLTDAQKAQNDYSVAVTGGVTCDYTYINDNTGNMGVEYNTSSGAVAIDADASS
jgi:MSHA pilin protein MshB